MGKSYRNSIFPLIYPLLNPFPKPPKPSKPQEDLSRKNVSTMRCKSLVNMVSKTSEKSGESNWSWLEFVRLQENCWLLMKKTPEDFSKEPLWWEEWLDMVFWEKMRTNWITFWASLCINSWIDDCKLCFSKKASQEASIMPESSSNRSILSKIFEGFGGYFSLFLLFQSREEYRQFTQFLGQDLKRKEYWFEA